MWKISNSIMNSGFLSMISQTLTIFNYHNHRKFSLVLSINNESCSRGFVCTLQLSFIILRLKLILKPQQEIIAMLNLMLGKLLSHETKRGLAVALLHFFLQLWSIINFRVTSFCSFSFQRNFLRFFTKFQQFSLEIFHEFVIQADATYSIGEITHHCQQLRQQHHRHTFWTVLFN